MNLHQTKLDIIEAGRRVYNQGYVASNDGNISCRVDEDRIVTTPTGMSKGFLKIEELVVTDMDGKKVSGVKNASSELGMHIFLYRERPDVCAVVHAHPPTATGFSVAGIPLTECVLPEVVITLGAIPIVDYGTPGGPEISEPIRKWVQDYDAYLLENHGATTIGNSVMNAYYKMETMEHFAKIMLVARQLGGFNTLNAEQVQKLVQIRERMGIRGPSPACDIGNLGTIQQARGAGAAAAGGIPTLKTRSAGESAQQPVSNGAAPQPDTATIDEITRRVIEALRSQG
jgi:L-fuculose-phosphate aldolase